MGCLAPGEQILEHQVLLLEHTHAQLVPFEAYIPREARRVRTSQASHT